MNSRWFAQMLATSVLLPVLAYGMEALQPDQLVCRSTHVVIATVVKATQNPQCFEPNLEFGRRPDCSPDHIGPMTIRVEEVLGEDRSDPSFPSNRKLKAGDVIVVWAEVRNNVGMEPSAIKFLENTPTPADSYIYIDPPTGLALSDHDLKRLLVGHSYIFGIDAYDRSEYPFRANMWQMKYRKWVNHTMNYSEACGSYCPRPLPESRMKVSCPAIGGSDQGKWR